MLVRVTDSRGLTHSEQSVLSRGLAMLDSRVRLPNIEMAIALEQQVRSQGAIANNKSVLGRGARCAR